jgi:hypothetical protein
MFETIELNHADLTNLASYIADYIAEEQSRGNKTVDKHMIDSAIDAFLGGAK